MAKRKKPTKAKSRRVQVLDRSQVSIRREANYIVMRAQINDSRVVGLNRLILFSTSTGDAWMLDPEDGLALCLARDGEKQEYTIVETDMNFGIKWNAQYRIEGGAFIECDKSGPTRTILGYPTDEIMKLCDGVGRQGQVSPPARSLRYPIIVTYAAPQHFLNFFPLPHGHGSFLPIFSEIRGCGGFIAFSSTRRSEFQIEITDIALTT